MDQIKTVEGNVAIELKTMPEIMTCECCGDEMELISIEVGYSCRNKKCLLHFNSSRRLAV